MSKRADRGLFFHSYIHTYIMGGWGGRREVSGRGVGDGVG